MSGVLSFLSSRTDPEAIIMMTDGSCYDDDGVLLDIRRKVAVSERLPLAVAFRGNLPFGVLVSQQIISAAEELGFDGMLADLAEVLPMFAKSPDLEILIAGLSETSGLMHRTFANKQLIGSKSPAFTLIDPGPVHWGLASETLNPISLNDIGIPAPAEGQTVQAWLTRYGLNIFDFHRRMRVPIDPTDPATDRQHLIGGILDMTVVKRGTVSTRILHRWPDRVGEKIDPYLSAMCEAA